MVRANPRQAGKNSSLLLSSIMQLVEKNALCISRSTVILLKAAQTQQGWAFGTRKPTWERAQLQTSCPGKKKGLSNVVGLDPELSWINKDKDTSAWKGYKQEGTIESG